MCDAANQYLQYGPQAGPHCVLQCRSVGRTAVRAPNQHMWTFTQQSAALLTNGANATNNQATPNQPTNPQANQLTNRPTN